MSTITKSFDKNNLEIINEKNNKIINYFVGLTQLIKIYLHNFKSSIDNKDLIYKINKNNEDIEDLTKELKKNKIIKNISVIEILDLYNSIINYINSINIIIIFIERINIYDEKTLISDSSKNNINNNKIAIIDSYNKIKQKSNKFLNDIITYFDNNIDYNKQNYLLLHNYYIKNTQIIELYSVIVKKYLANNSDNINNLILYNNINNKNLNIINELKKNNDNKIKYSINNLNQFYYLFYKNQNGINIKNNSIVNKFNFYTSHNKYNNLKDLLSDNLLINNNLSNEFNQKTYKSIQKIINDLYKLDMQFINISLIETNIENINYNIDTLLNPEYSLNKDIGINKKYINKTKTIITNEEYNTLPNIDNNYINEYYLSNFKSIYNINNFNYSNDKDNTLLNSTYIVINKIYLNSKDYLFHILKNVNTCNNNLFMKFNDIRLLLQNSPDYYIENYNIYRNKLLIEFTKSENILNLYNSKITNDYKNIKKIDNLQLKNNIVNTIKKTKFKLTTSNKNNSNELKQKNIEKIINIINDELYKYIKSTNNIDFTPELMLTYYSNINSLIIKVKKELNDNYNEDIINNIENILNNIYSNIISINSNIIDKFYLTQL